jgi:hypothetical protein
VTQYDTGDRWPLYMHLYDGPMFDEWHWLEWNFGHLRDAGTETEFAVLTLNALLRCDGAMPGFATEMLDRVASFGGRDRNRDDYQSILQWLAELVTANHFVTWPWSAGTRFEHEPTTTKGGPNPEFIVTGDGWRLGVEVKCPDLRRLQEQRAQNHQQVLSRLPESVFAMPVGGITLPRDNPLKDFLHHCEKKFGQFRRDSTFRSVLVVVWDDHIQEPISALLAPSSGLFTGNSFDRGPDGTRFTYPATDAVVVLRHQHQLIRALANRPMIDDRDSFLDWGEIGRFPHNALIVCPDGESLPDELLESLQAVPPAPMLGAEYIPSDITFWFDA